MKINKQRVAFIKYGILSRCYGLIGKAFRSRKYLDKSVDYMDKRWDMVLNQYED